MVSSSVDEFLNLNDVKKVDASTFFSALKEAKKRLEFEAFVTLHPVEEYEKCVGTFLLFDKTAGVAVEKDGNIISVFSDRTHKDASRYLIAKAIKFGGIKLDCFYSKKLSGIYLTRGFIPVSKTKFVKEFAPENWNYKRDGEPDIYFWIYENQSKNPLVDVIRKVDWEAIPEFPSYDEAKAYRDRLLEKKAK